MNIAAALTKIDLLFDATKGVFGYWRFALTDLEYLLVACRSLYDLLQEVAKQLWERVKLAGGDKKQPLPTRFSKVVLKSNKSLAAKEIEKRFGLPRPVAGFYAEAAPFFEKLRTARDRILHGASQDPVILRLDDGPGFLTSVPPFNDLVPWQSNHLRENGVSSLRYLVAYVVHETIVTCEKFAAVLLSNLTVPEDIAPDCDVFLRSAHTEALSRVPEVLKAPWTRLVRS